MSDGVRFATVISRGKMRYGAVTDRGFIDLSARHGDRWPTLRHVIEDQALQRLADAGAGLTEDFPLSDVTFAIRLRGIVHRELQHIAEPSRGDRPVYRRARR